MARPDLNLLVALEVLLEEGSVARAARRLKLSASAMSRTLARLRVAVGDPLLVRAGRGLVFTPRALELRDRVGRVVQDAEGVLSPAAAIVVAQIERTFTLRTGEGFVENFGPGLIQRVAREAPRVRLRFLQKWSRDSASLRDGTVDLETGVVGRGASPEVRTKILFRDRLVGVVRADHPLAGRSITAVRYAKAEHVEVPQHAPGPVDEALRILALEREVPVVVGGFSSALAIARASDYVATVPERHTGNLRSGMFSFALPFSVQDFAVSLLWHPRLDNDPAHLWLRQCVLETCAEAPACAPGKRPASGAEISPGV